MKAAANTTGSAAVDESPLVGMMPVDFLVPPLIWLPTCPSVNTHAQSCTQRAAECKCERSVDAGATAWVSYARKLRGVSG